MKRFSSTESEGKSFLPSGTMAMPRATISEAGRAPIGSPSELMASGSFWVPAVDAFARHIVEGFESLKHLIKRHEQAVVRGA